MIIDYVIDEENKIIVALLKNNEGLLISKGISKCHPQDVYDIRIGMLVAKMKAVQKRLNKLSKEVLLLQNKSQSIIMNEMINIDKQQKFYDRMQNKLSYINQVLEYYNS